MKYPNISYYVRRTVHTVFLVSYLQVVTVSILGIITKQYKIRICHKSSSPFSFTVFKEKSERA